MRTLGALVKILKHDWGGEHGQSRLRRHPCHHAPRRGRPSRKAIAADLAGLLGFDPVHLGPHSAARLLEPFALVWITLAYRQGWAGTSCSRSFAGRPRPEKRVKGAVSGRQTAAGGESAGTLTIRRHCHRLENAPKQEQ